MKQPSFLEAAFPALRKGAIPALLISASALAGCAQLQKPPELRSTTSKRRRNCNPSRLGPSGLLSCRSPCRCPAS
jgi:hypothetical protein